MLHESAHVRVSADDGIATLFLSPPGGLLAEAVLNELPPALERVANTPGLEILVLRAGTPAGFGRGVDPRSLDALETEDDAARFVRTGQRVCSTLADLPVVTLAFLEGPTTGPGLELALACDFRLAVAGPDSWVSFGGIPLGWGGRTRLRKLARRASEGPAADAKISAREATRLGLFDHAFCERRAKIELRTWLDRLQRHPRKRSTGEAAGLASERRAFRAAWRTGFDLSSQPVAVLPKSVGLVGVSSLTRTLAAECSMRCIPVTWAAGAGGEVFAEALRRGRITPLEAEQAVKRIRFADDADAVSECEWVVLADPHTDLAAMLERDLPPRTVLCVPPAHLERVAELSARPHRVSGLRIDGETATVTRHPEAEGVEGVRGWLAAVGCGVNVERMKGDATTPTSPRWGEVGCVATG